MILDEVRTLCAFMEPGGDHHRALVAAAVRCVRAVYRAWTPRSVPASWHRRLEACAAWAARSAHLRREQAWLLLGAAGPAPAVDLLDAIARGIGEVSALPDAFAAVLRVRSLQLGDPALAEREVAAAVHDALGKSRPG